MEAQHPEMIQCKCPAPQSTAVAVDDSTQCGHSGNIDRAVWRVWMRPQAKAFITAIAMAEWSAGHRPHHTLLTLAHTHTHNHNRMVIPTVAAYDLQAKTGRERKSRCHPHVATADGLARSTKVCIVCMYVSHKPPQSLMMPA